VRRWPDPAPTREEQIAALIASGVSARDARSRVLRAEQQHEDRIVKAIAAAVVLVVLVVFVGGGLLLRAKLPCSWLNTLPAKDVPGRCLTVEVRS
jgi:hypothetical protein